jgi:hypothetical protein
MATKVFLFSVIDKDVCIKISDRSILLFIRLPYPLNLLMIKSPRGYIYFLNCIYSDLCYV